MLEPDIGREDKDFGGDDILTQNFQGVLGSSQQLEQGAHGHDYRATLVPRLWRSSLEQQSQVYQNTEIPHIIEEELNYETSDITRITHDPIELDDAEDWEEPEDRLDKADRYDEEEEDDEEDEED